jgi:hypothetical protein
VLTTDVIPRLASDRGSALMLMPAAVLIVLVLAAITVDTAVVHLARRDLLHAADAAANDAVTYGLDEDRLRRGDGYRLDHRRVHQAVHGALESRGLLDRLAAPPGVTVIGDDRVVVVVRMQVEHVFARALPGAGTTRVEVRSSATAAQR